VANKLITDANSLSGLPGDELPVNRSGSDGKVTLPFGTQYTSTGPNYIVIANSTASGDGITSANNPVISVSGTDTHAGLTLRCKGDPNSDRTFKFDMGTGSNNDFPGSEFYLGGTGGGGPNVHTYWDRNALGGEYAGGFACAMNDSTGAFHYWGSMNVIAETATGSNLNGYIYFNTMVNSSKVTQGYIGNGWVIGNGAWPGHQNIGMNGGKGFFDQVANELLIFQQASTVAKNYFEITNASSATNPVLSAAGDDTNVGMTFTVKGGPTVPFTFNAGTGSQPEVYIQSEGAGANDGPAVTLYHDSTSPAVNDVVGKFNFNGNDAGFAEANYAHIAAVATNVTGGAETGYIEIATRVTDVKAGRFYVGNGVVVGSSFPFPGAGRLAVDQYVQTGRVTVTNLPVAATTNAGARHFVTDATTNAFMAPAVGGSTYMVPVVSIGTGWVIG
jgi:hypothetical protein